MKKFKEVARLLIPTYGTPILSSRKVGHNQSSRLYVFSSFTLEDDEDYEDEIFIREGEDLKWKVSPSLVRAYFETFEGPPQYVIDVQHALQSVLRTDDHAKNIERVRSLMKNLNISVDDLR